MKYQHAIVLALVATASLVFAQAPQHRHRPAKPPVTMPAMGMGMDMRKCMSDMAAGQKKLDALVARMNASDGVQRIDASAALLTELVKQHRDMVQMCHEMMGGHGMHMGHRGNP